MVKAGALLKVGFTGPEAAGVGPGVALAGRLVLFAELLVVLQPASRRTSSVATTRGERSCPGALRSSPCTLTRLPTPTNGYRRDRAVAPDGLPSSRRLRRSYGPAPSWRTLTGRCPGRVAERTATTLPARRVCRPRAARPAQ